MLKFAAQISNTNALNTVTSHVILKPEGLKNLITKKILPLHFVQGQNDNNVTKHNAFVLDREIRAILISFLTLLFKKFL